MEDKFITATRRTLALHLRSLQARLNVVRATAVHRVLEAREFERQLRDRRIARQRQGSRSQQLFGKGSIAEQIGYLDIPDYAILGLEAHGLLYASFIAQAALETSATDRGSLLRHVFSCPSRKEWCVKEGARVSMESSRAADEKRTAEFRERQAENPSRSWRKEPVTEFQLYRISAVEARLDVAAPVFKSRGAAADWIALRVADPRYWQIPEKLPPWKAQP